MRMLRVAALQIAILVTVAGCRDAMAPIADAPATSAFLAAAPGASAIPMLRQAPSAPALETYQVSFWARSDRASTVIVNYQPDAGQTTGAPFLRFDVPKDALRGRHHGHGPHDDHGARDSVLITLTIDPTDFTVDFQPSGVVFSKRHPATLAIWYGNANPDLNSDGAVDETDRALTEQLAIWVRQARPAPWFRLMSETVTGEQWVFTAVPHFSDYAVSW